MTLPAPFTHGLAAAAYLSRDALASEQRLWSSVWVVVGYARDLDAPDAFLTARLGRLEIVVQRYGDGLSAFVNRCAHRGSVLHTERRGDCALVCPYHGWRYDRAGLPQAIPFLPPAALATARALPELALRRLAIESRHGLVWVCAADEPVPLAEFLGEETDSLLATIAPLGPAGGEPFGRETETWAANWKICIEGTLEGIHVPFVHAPSFHEVVDARATEVTCHGRHLVQVTRLSAETAAWWRRFRARTGLPTSTIDPDTYTHALIFPSFAVGVTGGALVSTQMYTPTGTASTELDHVQWLPTSERSNAGSRALVRGVASKLGIDNHGILDEDRAAAERVQRGLEAANDPAHRIVITLPAEERIARFHQAIEELI
ncbi:MAG TPA: aromatic ring-hydroxylating dioxygenase subunit alpha [Kofleriaceae bacterium]|jgi:phenylpropionate dioxygenase-like ring-hydroxylating dioxygenase large terminal subunit